MFHKRTTQCQSFVFLLLLGSCSPSFNWREYRFEDDPLTFLIPCKPKEQRKEVSIDKEKQVLVMAACNVENTNFTISRLKRAENMKTEDMIVLWQKASLHALTGSDHIEEPSKDVKKLKIENKEVMVYGLSNHKGIQADWRWFEQGQWVYQLGIYLGKKQEKNKVNFETQNMFFESIR